VIAELASRQQLADFAPLAERAAAIDNHAVIRFRGTGDAIAGFVRLPYDVLAGRTIAAEAVGQFDVTVAVTDLLTWLDEDGPIPARRDAHWLSPLPPQVGWERVESVPDSEVRSLIRSGAALAQDASNKAGQEALLSSIVLTATSADRTVEVALGPLSALTRMGFLPRGAQTAVDVAPGWIRIAAPYGSTFVTTGVSPLGMLNLGPL
jgi:hypothetical protein